MTSFQLILRRLRALFRQESLDAEMSEEIRHHLELQERENITRGMSPAEARYAAQRMFGGVEQVKDRARDVRRCAWLEQLGQDVRFTLRSLRKAPGFAFVVVATLALGLGANTAIFSVVHAVLLKALPYREPEELVRVFATPGRFRGGTTAPDFVDWREATRSFTGMAATVGRSYNLSGDGEPERVAGTRASANYFDVLGISPLVGRTFSIEEDREGATPVALLSHGFWQRRFAGDRAVVGRKVLLDNEPHTVVGVLPASIELQTAGAQVWTPLALTANELRSTGARRFLVTARLRAGVTREQADAEMQVITEQIETKRPGSNRGWRAAVVPLGDVLVGDMRSPLFVLLGAVGLVLLIACANVAGLMLARSQARMQEFAVRAALGADRGRIVRHVLTESFVLAAIGGGLGLWLAARGIDGLVALLPASIPRLGQVQIDSTVLAFSAGLILLTSGLFGLAPTLQAARADVNDALKRGGRGGGMGAGRLRRGLVVTEIAFALVLLIGAGLLGRSFWRMQHVATGLPDTPLLALTVALPETRYARPAQLTQFFDRMAERLEVAPEVPAFGFSSNVPFDTPGSQFSINILGRPPVDPQKRPMVYYRAVSPGYFATLGVPPVAGRSFTDADRPGAPRVGLINQTMARRLFPGEEALGQRFLVDDSERTPIEVVGIVADVKHLGPTTDPVPELFVPYAQASESLWRFMARTMSVVVQPRSDPAAALAAVRQAISAGDANLPLFRVITLQQLRNDAVALSRVYGVLLGGFALVALLLATIGIYGVIAYTVEQRRREIGVRVALGASRRDVLRLVVGDGARLAGIGAGCGLLAALGLTRLIATQLYGVSTTDPVVFVGVAVVIITIALVATWLPALRATKVDPVVALRAE